MIIYLVKTPWICVFIDFYISLMTRSYLVAEWKHSVEAGENEADECIQTVPNLKADNIPCKKVPVCLVHSFTILLDHFSLILRAIVYQTC